MSEQVQSSLAGEVEALTPQQRERLRVDRLTPSHQAEVRKEHEARLEAERKATWLAQPIGCSLPTGSCPKRIGACCRAR